ncbi:MAG: hypothetical protein ACYDCD_14440 [Candidatus Acidiferrales bacterium]
MPLTGFLFAAFAAMVLMMCLGPYRYAPRVTEAQAQPEVAG